MHMQTQTRDANNEHRLFPFMVTAGSLGIVFIALILILAAQRFLLPGLISLGSFILFVLWLTGLIETSLQLYGVSGSVNDKCGNWVVGNGVRGESIEALAWLTQITICMFPFPLFSRYKKYRAVLTLLGNCWKAAFAFELVNTIFFLWMLVMAWQVHRDVYG